MDVNIFKYLLSFYIIFLSRYVVQTLVALHFNQRKSQNLYKVYISGLLSEPIKVLPSLFLLFFSVTPVQAYTGSWLLFLHSKHVLTSQSLGFRLILLMDYSSSLHYRFGIYHVFSNLFPQISSI